MAEQTQESNTQSIQSTDQKSENKNTIPPTRQRGIGMRLLQNV